MPISQRNVKRSHAALEQKFLQHSSGEDILTDKTYSQTVSCMQQLSDLAKYSSEIFAELVLLSADVKVRYDSLAARTAKLQLALPKLVITKTALNIASDEYQHHRQMLQTPQSQHLVDHTTLPHAMQLRYSSSEVKPRVQFHALDGDLGYLPLGPKAKTISQRYSNPEYFLSQWCAAQVERMKQLEREKKQQRADKKLRKNQRQTESAPETRQPRRRSSVKWQDRYMVDGKAVNRKSVNENAPKGTRLSLIATKVPAKKEGTEAEADAEEAEDEDLSAKNSPVGPALAPVRNFATSLMPPIEGTSEVAGSSKSSPLVLYSQIYPSKSTKQFDADGSMDESTPVDQSGLSPGSLADSSAPGTGPVSPEIASRLPAAKPAPPAPPVSTGSSASAPVPGPAEGDVPPKPPVPQAASAPAPPPPAPPAPPAASVFKPQPDGLSLASNKPATTPGAPPPPPPASKTAGPPPPPPLAVRNSDDGNIDKMIASGLVPPPPTVEQLRQGTAKSTEATTDASTSANVAGVDSDSDAEEDTNSEETPAAPVPVQAAVSSKGNYLDEMLSGTIDSSMGMMGFLRGGARPAPPPPPPPASARTASTDASVGGAGGAAGPGVASPVRVLLKPRPPSSGTDASSSTPHTHGSRAAHLSTGARTASTDSVSSQLSGYPFLASGGGLSGVSGVSALLSGLTVAADEEEETDHFAAVNSAQSSFAKEPISPVAPTAGRVSLLDAIKQGTGLRKVSTPGPGDERKSGGRVSLLDAIKQGGGTLRKVSAQEQAAAVEEKKRSGSSLGGFGSSSVTAILERRKFLMAEESSDSDSDDGEWS